MIPNDDTGDDPDQKNRGQVQSEQSDFKIFMT